jgi:hypothetical protein
MSETFHRARFGKQVCLTNHAIEAMAKQYVTLTEIRALIEQGRVLEKGEEHAWRSHPRCVLCSAPRRLTNLHDDDVSRRSASAYLAAVFSMISWGSSGPGGLLSHSSVSR